MSSLKPASCYKTLITDYGAKLESGGGKGEGRGGGEVTKKQNFKISPTFRVLLMKITATLTCKCAHTHLHTCMYTHTHTHTTHTFNTQSHT